MANTFTNILPTLMAQALDVLRETCVMPRLVNTDFSNLPAGDGDTVNMIVSSAATVSSVSASATPVTPPDNTPTKVSVTLNQWKKAGFHLTDKERGEIPNGWRPKQLQEVVKALANDVNSYILGLYTGIYGYTGTAGTTPFGGSNLADATAARKILNQQLAPMSDRRMVVDPSAEANALTLLANANFRGETGTLVQGSIGRILGSDWFMDQLVPTHTRNALGAGALTINGVNALNATSISIAKAAGANWNAKKGDIITIAGDSQTYVITADTTVVQATNTSVPISPPLKVATVGAEAVTSIDTHVVNLNFHPDAFAFASRALQSEAAQSENIFSIADPVSQVVLRLERIRQNKQDYIEADILYGCTLARAELATRIAG